MSHAKAKPISQAAARARLLRWNLAATSLIWLVFLAVTAIWLAGGAGRDLRESPGNAVSALGALVGLLAAAALLLQIIMMARIPVFVRGLGIDGIVHTHKRLGWATLVGVLLHIALTIAGYAWSLEQGPWTQFLQFMREFRGVPLAVAGTGLLLIFVGAMSLRRVRARLRYERWHLAHLVAYLAAALSVPHMVLAGASFKASPAAQVLWWTLWGLAMAATCWWRAIVPAYRTWHYHLRVTTVEPDGARGLLVTMRGRDLGRLKARGGQFFYWRFLGSPGRTRANPFSLAAQGEDEFTVAVRVVGDGTQRISRLRPGTRVYFEGPYGNVTGDRRHGHRLLMIGAGAGVGPLMSILDEQHWEPGEATLISRENVESDVMMRTQIELMVAERGLNWDLQIGPPGQKDGGLTWLPAQAGPAAEVLAGLLEDPQATDVYLCGPPPWMSGVTRDVVAAGVPPGQIHSESFNF